MHVKNLILAGICLSGAVVSALKTSGPSTDKAAKQHWENLNPGSGGRIVSCYLNPEVPGRIYYCSDMEGISRSNDNGKTWQYIGKDLFHGYSVTVTSDPEDANRVYAGTHYGLHISDNAGNTWKLAEGTRNQGIGRITVNSHNPQIIYAGPGWGARVRCMAQMGQVSKGDRFILISRDRGANWTRHVFEPASGDRTIYSISVQPAKPDTIFVTNVSGIYRSDDGGGHWTKMSLPPGATGSFGASFSPDGNILYASLMTPGVSKLKKGRWAGREASIYALNLKSNTWFNLSINGLPVTRLGYRYGRPKVDPCSTSAKHRILTASRSERKGLMQGTVNWKNGKPAKVAWESIFYWKQGVSPKTFDLGWEQHTPRAEWYAYAPKQWPRPAIWTTSGQALFQAYTDTSKFPGNWNPKSCRMVKKYKLSGRKKVTTYRTRGVQCTYNYDMAAHDNYVVQCQADNGVLESWDNGYSWTPVTKPRRWKTSNSQAVVILDKMSPPVVLIHSAFGYGSKAKNGELFAKRLKYHSPKDQWVLIAGGKAKKLGLPNEIIHDITPDTGKKDTVYLALNKRGIYQISDIGKLLDDLSAKRPVKNRAKSITANSLPARARVTNLRADPHHPGILYATVRLKGIWKGSLKGNRWRWEKIKDKGSSLAVWAWGPKTVIFNGMDVSLDGGKSWKTVVDSEKLFALRKAPWTNKKKNYLSISSPAGIGNKCFLTFHDWVFKRGFGEFQVTLNDDGTATVKDITGDLPLPSANRARVINNSGNTYLYLASRQNGLWRLKIKK
jgi:hypothetical protein